MNTFPLCVNCAIETLTASGARTRSRLDGLVEHYATTYGHTPEVIRAMQQQAARHCETWLADYKAGI